MMSRKVRVPAAARFMRAISPSSAPSFSAFSIETCRRSAEAGLTTKSTAPARMAPTTVSMPPWAVCTMTGIARSSLAELRQHRHAVEVGHDEVEDDERDRRRRRGRSGSASAASPPSTAIGAMAEALDRRREQAALDGIVVDDEDGGRHRGGDSVRRSSRCGTNRAGDRQSRRPGIRAR